MIHAGIYYPAGSLMARACVEGKHMLYDYCRERGVPHARCGKLIVATNEEEAGKLAVDPGPCRRQRRARPALLTRDEALALEPALSCTAALLSPSTGIIDSHAFMLSLQGDAENAGAVFAFHAPVDPGASAAEGIEIAVGGAEPMELRCRTLVNAAGLHAPRLARALDGMPQDAVPGALYAKGNYFTLTGRNALLPPDLPGAGAGRARHSPDDRPGRAGAVRAGRGVGRRDRLRRSIPRRGESFYAAIRRYWPGLPDGALAPGYSGIRPKTVPPGAPAQDFVIQGPEQHGVPGIINLFGIESPGLTASLALGRSVSDIARG